jgi:hypothetical protein
MFGNFYSISSTIWKLFRHFFQGLENSGSLSRPILWYRFSNEESASKGVRHEKVVDKKAYPEGG